MSIHPSLKISSGLVRHKNVLTKKERIQRLRENDLWDDEKNTLYGMQKVGNRKIVGKKKAKKKED